MATALEVPDLIIRPISNHCSSAWITSKEMFANKGTVFSLKGLVITIKSCIHDVNERTFAVLGKKWIPSAAPHNLDDIPACTTED